MHLGLHRGQYSYTEMLHDPSRMRLGERELLVLTLSLVWWGRCEKMKEEVREGGEKSGPARARRARGSNPGPAAC